MLVTKIVVASAATVNNSTVNNSTVVEKVAIKPDCHHLTTLNSSGSASRSTPILRTGVCIIRVKMWLETLVSN